MMNEDGGNEFPLKNDKFDGEFLTLKVSGQRLVDGSNEVSPVSSSRYSSCGESEFDRYCSANSVMGTPSFCGSVGACQDFHDLDFGSLKSSKLGDVSCLESFSLSGKFESKNSLSLHRSGECSQGRESSDVWRGLEKVNGESSERRLVVTENGLRSYDETETNFQDFADGGGVAMLQDGIRSNTMQDTSTNASLGAEATEERVLNTGVNEGSESCMGVGFEGGGYSGERSEGETSSRLEYSESEGSLYGYGTDNEERVGLAPRGYLHYTQDKRSKNENTLQMTSSIAYGSDDWDDFMQNPQVPLAMDEIQVRKQNQKKSIELPLEQENVKDFRMSDQVNFSHESPVYSRTRSMNEEQGEVVKDMSQEGINQLKMEDAPLMDVIPRKPENTNSTETAHNLTRYVTLGHTSSTSAEDDENRISEIPKDRKPVSLPSLSGINIEKRENTTPVSLSTLEDHQTASKVEKYELNEFYDEVVYEMEEILLDSGESPAARFTHGRRHHSQVSLPSRDGGSTASTSSIGDTHALPYNGYVIDGVEVVGAKQKKGDVSLGERLVGVREYTVYKLRVWNQTHQWQVERRYRDFFTLYRRLKTSFANKGWDLPSPWLSVDRQSRKFFGNASPDVILERSVLIQECLQSILHSRFSSSLPSSLIWFLSPPKNELNPPTNHTSSSQNLSTNTPTPAYTLGQSISLIVELRPPKSTGQMLEAQHYTCAGCHKYFDEGKTQVWEFVQTLGWAKPRLCEYSGQLFCSLCHVNETAILPARVLHLWDFTEYPVSQLTKSYLDSIHDKPMLCVSAVNPFLFSKVPPLQHVTNVRKRIGRMLPYVRCPFRSTIYKGVGSRRYILESTDFFALKDLIDLSKGVFAALPVMVETVSRRIVEHITDECLICYDVGVPCSARQACDDPSSLIFPFQEGEVERCKSCDLVYHKACFKKMATCPCGVDLGSTTAKRNPNVGPNQVINPSNDVSLKTESRSSLGFLSGLLSKASPAKLWRPKDNDTVISMGSLPSSST